MSARTPKPVAPRRLCVAFGDGRRELVSPARAARLLHAGLAEPGAAWSTADMALVLNAHEARMRTIYLGLVADGVVVGTGEDVPRAPWWDIFRRGF